MYEDIAQAAEMFLSSAPDAIEELRGGHISQSYLVCSRGEKYVLQRLKSSVYTAKGPLLKKLYMAYSKAYECMKDKKDWYIPLWQKDRNGAYLYTDERGNIWRAYRYIEGRVGADDPHALGEGLARLHNMLSFCEPLSEPLMQGLHDLRAHYAAYLNADRTAQAGDVDVERRIKKDIDGMLGVPLREDAVVHNDARKENAVFSGGRVIAFVDIDAVSKGSRLIDIADAVRSCCYGDGCLDKTAYRALLDGYKENGGGLLDDDEEAMILPVLGRIRFELGLRYYNDHLTGGSYFADLTAEEKLAKARRYMDI